MDELTRLALSAIESKKAEDIRIYDMKNLTPFVDVMIVCSTNNLRQNNAVVAALRDTLKEHGLAGQFNVEGRQDSRWILIDLGDVVVHVFVKEERDYYGLDRLYRDVLVEKRDV